MDEYIKREDALKAIRALPNVCGCSAIDSTDAEDAIMDCPTAEVAPKSEVERVFSDLKKEIHDNAVYPHCHGVEPYISLKVFDAVINKLIGS